MRNIITKNSVAPRAGFTLLELITVLLVIGIMTAIALARPPSNTYAVVEAQRLKSYIRFAQYQAMTQSIAAWGIQQGGGGASYTLFTTGTATPVLPDQGQATYNLPTGVTVSIPGGSISFDEWGSPGAANQTIQINGESTINITVTAYTGFIQ